MVIVYTSNTGYTRQYAQMLAKAEKRKAYELSQAQLPGDTPVLYMGPLMAGHVTGLDKAAKRFSLRGVCGVGMSMPGESVMASMRRANSFGDLPVFYLRGGWDPKGVGWLKRRMVNMATRSLRRSLLAKKTRTHQEQVQLSFLLQGGSFVAYQNLSQLRAWLKDQKE